MANNQIGGSFEMFEAEAALGGGKPTNTLQAQNSPTNGFLPLDQLLGGTPPLPTLETQGFQTQYQAPLVESKPNSFPASLGLDNKQEIIFNDPKELLLSKLMNESVEEVRAETDKVEQAIKVEDSPSPEVKVNKTVEKAKSIAQNTAKSSIKTTITAARDLYKETKELFSAIGNLFKDYITFKLETKEQKAAREKAEIKKKEKTMTLKATISEFKAALSTFLMKKQKDSHEDQQRWEITGLGIAERNKAMGSTRNLSNIDIDTKYHNYETYVGMVRARENEKKKEMEIKKQQTQAIDRTQIKYAGEIGGSQHVLNTAG